MVRATFGCGATSHVWVKHGHDHSMAVLVFCILSKIFVSKTIQIETFRTIDTRISVNLPVIIFKHIHEHRTCLLFVNGLKIS